MTFSISRAQRAGLLAGSLEPLKFDLPQRKPLGCNPGAIYVLSWRKAWAVLCDDGHIIRHPRSPLRYITVTDVKRHRNGGWRVRFDAHDLRDTDRYVRRTPPVMSLDTKRSGDGSEESSYQTTRWGAIDELPAVPTAYQKELAREAFERDHVVRLDRAVKARSDRLRRGRKRAA